MLTAEKKNALGRKYQISADGQPVAVWDPSFWRSGGDFEIDGHRFQVRANAWGTKYRMLDQAGNDVAVVEQAGRKHWSVQADGRTYEFPPRGPLGQPAGVGLGRRQGRLAAPHEAPGRARSRPICRACRCRCRSSWWPSR
jgi:hypothetical protein